MGEANFYYFTCLKFVYEQQPFFSLLLHDGLLASTVKWGPRLSPSRRCRRPDHRRPRRSIIRAEGQRRRSAPVERTRRGAAGGEGERHAFHQRASPYYEVFVCGASLGDLRIG